MYEQERQELENIAVSTSQSVKHRSVYNTVLAKAVINNRDFMSRHNIDILVVIKAILDILDALQMKGRIRRYIKVGRIIISAISNVKTKKGLEWTRINKYFDMREFVDRRAFKKIANGSSFGLYADSRIIAIATYIREKSGRAVTINNWMYGGRLSQRAFRGFWSKVGSKSSMHRKAQAIDISVSGWSAKRVQEFIIDHATELHKLGLRRVEKLEYTPTWTHLDTKGERKTIYFFKP